MKLWLDDKRKPPWGYDLWAKTAKEAIQMLEEHGEKIVHCSLDHDLADEHYKELLFGWGPEPDPIDRSAFVELTGYAVLEWMHEKDRWVPDISIHTLNPKGGADMLRKLESRAPAHVKFRRVDPAVAAKIRPEK
ncbi:MAG TPA: cyclic-phosphate processing receiver domain-containing protein [Polyangiaceae bacterium]|nr:cyclic-phosphate processing receiver domain-containing protein [Polyangiaceae bacterium]